MNSRLLYTTAPGTGFEVLDVSGGTAQYLAQVPWDVDGLSGGRNARPRVTLDGRHIFGVMTPGLEDPTVWAETEVSNHVTSLDDLAAVRLPVAAGNFGYRYGISARYALWAGYGADGGNAYLLDADATSDTFGTAIATIPIDLPTGAATPGEDFAGSETYNTAVTSDGRYGLVSINGDSRVIVLDLERREQIGETEIGVPLSGYTGYLMVVESARSPVDLWAR